MPWNMHAQGHMQNLSERELTSLLGYNVMPGTGHHCSSNKQD